MQVRAGKFSFLQLFALTNQQSGGQPARIAALAVNQLQAEPDGQSGRLLLSRLQIIQLFPEFCRAAAAGKFLKRGHGLFSTVERLLQF